MHSALRNCGARHFVRHVLCSYVWIALVATKLQVCVLILSRWGAMLILQAFTAVFIIAAILVLATSSPSCLAVHCTQNFLLSLIPFSTITSLLLLVTVILLPSLTRLLDYSAHVLSIYETKSWYQRIDFTMHSPIFFTGKDQRMNSKVTVSR